MKTYVVFFRKGFARDGYGVKVINAIDEAMATSAILESEMCYDGKDRPPKILKVVPLIDLVTKALN